MNEARQAALNALRGPQVQRAIHNNDLRQAAATARERATAAANAANAAANTNSKPSWTSHLPKAATTAGITQQAFWKAGWETYNYFYPSGVEDKTWTDTLNAQAISPESDDDGRKPRKAEVVVSNTSAKAIAVKSVAIPKQSSISISGGGGGGGGWIGASEPVREESSSWLILGAVALVLLNQ